MMKCPSCAHENVDGTTFCEMCGEDLQNKAGAAPSAGSTPGTSPSGATTAGGEIKCPACDNMNPPENVVCEVCGTDLKSGIDANAGSTGAATSGAASGAATPSTPASDASAASTSAPPSPVPSTPDPAADPATAAALSPGGGDASNAASPTVTPTTSTPAAPVAAPDASSATTAPATTPFDTMTTPAVPATPAPATTDPSAPSAPLEPGKVKLVVEQGMTVGKQFILGDAELQVGREDEDDAIYPDIDLADQDEGYVHRKHATLKFENGALFVTHLGGANKTRVNNKPIPDNTPEQVKMGDKIAFGKVVMRVTAI